MSTAWQLAKKWINYYYLLLYIILIILINYLLYLLYLL